MSEKNITTTGAQTVPSFADLLTTKQAAELTGHPETVLNQYRTLRRRGRELGPEYITIGRAVFYPSHAVEAYVAGRRG